MQENHILEAVLKIASNNYTADPSQVLERSAQFFLKTLTVHLEMLKSNKESRGEVFDAESLIKDVFADLQKQVLAKIDTKPPSNIVTLSSKKRIL